MISVLDAWNAHKGELLRFVQSRVQDPEEAHDIVQETFFRAMRQAKGLDDVGNPRAWLFQAARNLISTASASPRNRSLYRTTLRRKSIVTPNPSML